MSGFSLYKQNLGTPASATLIKTFETRYFLQEDGMTANSIILIKGDQIYEYTDTLNIP
jgi:hypothetical protein